MKKNILIISEVYKKGGAGNATNNFFDFLTEIYNTKLIVPHTKTKTKNIINYYNNFSYLIYIVYKLFNRLLSFFFFQIINFIFLINLQKDVFLIQEKYKKK